MKAKITVTEDTFSEYLDFVYNSFHENAPKELKREARLLTGDEWDADSGFIAKYMSTTFNPNLYASGQEADYWVVKNKSNPHGLMGGSNVSTLEIYYTGMRLHNNYDDEARVWWEFAEGQEADPTERVLERDYSFYQETGIDPIALPKYAKHTGAIAKGVRESKDTLLTNVSDYYYNIMRKGKGDIPPRLI